jgi:hypothetical protein
MGKRLGERGEEYGKRLGMSAQEALGWLVVRAENGESPLKGDCLWSQVPEGEYWDTSCGAEFEGDEIGPEKSDVVFCPKCGGAIEVVEAEKVQA